jgi:hypothetical protein
MNTRYQKYFKTEIHYKSTTTTNILKKNHKPTSTSPLEFFLLTKSPLEIVELLKT